MSDWHPEDIKAAVRKRGTTLAGIAETHGASRAAFTRALTVPREKAERAIAAFLNVHPKIIWPSRYESTGERKRPQPCRNYTAQARFGNTANERAA